MPLMDPLQWMADRLTDRVLEAECALEQQQHSFFRFIFRKGIFEAVQCSKSCRGLESRSPAPATGPRMSVFELSNVGSSVDFPPA